MSKKLSVETLEKKCRRYNAIRDEIERLKAEQEAIRNTLEEQVDDHSYAVYGAWEVDWTRRNNSKTDYARMFKEHPEIKKADYTTVTTSYAISLKRK